MYRLPYYEACVRDACGCDTGGDCECLCDAVAAYAQACLDKGVCVDWRAPDFCRECPAPPRRAAQAAAPLLGGRQAGTRRGTPRGPRSLQAPAEAQGPSRASALPAIYCGFYNTHARAGAGRLQYTQEADCTWHYQPCLCPQHLQGLPGANMEGTGHRGGELGPRD